MGKDDATWLNICYLALAGILAYVAFSAFYTVGLQSGWSDRFDDWYPLLSRMGALLAGGGAVLWLRSSISRREYHLSAIGEVRKVTWPSAADTKRMTLVVVVVVAIFSVILTIFDILWSKVLQFILS